jgi:hypothetical protein
MIGLSFALLLITAGLFWRFKQHRQVKGSPARGDFSPGWRERELPLHEHEQSKRR